MQGISIQVAWPHGREERYEEEEEGAANLVHVFYSMGSGDLRGSGGYHDSVGPVGGDFLFSLCS